MRAPSRIVLASLALAALLFAGCAQDHDSITAPHDAASPAAEKGIPAGYYDTVDATNATTLRATLHAVIDDHTRIPYTSTATDTWDVLEVADQDPLDSGRVLDVYMNESYIKHGAGNTDYNREHSWPKSYGFPNDGSTNYPYTDCHHLFISNDSRNSSRSNKPYGTAGGSGTEYVTVFYNGVGGGSGVYPGWSNWADATYWETWMHRRGDVYSADSAMASGPALTASPNPFNPMTEVFFRVPMDGRVRLTVYDVKGRSVATLVDADMSAGAHAVTWSAGQTAGGVYFARLEAPGVVETSKLILLK